MFTGLVRGRGQVHEVTAIGQDLRLVVEAGVLAGDRVRIGDSVAVSGVCLTVADQLDSLLIFDVSVETLTRTWFRRLRKGATVNLEPSLRVGDELGGHFVTGHVDAVGSLRSRRESGRSEVLAFSAPPRLARYLAEKGSVAVDGVSLTVNAVGGIGPKSDFACNIVPHTLLVTTLKELRPGDSVHIEIDLIARYLARLADCRTG